MSDQCKYCSCHQDIDSCMATDCSIKDSWYAKRLEAEIAKLKDDITHLGLGQDLLMRERDELKDLIRRAMPMYSPDAESHPRWAVVARIFSIGSTSATRLCDQAGVRSEEILYPFDAEMENESCQEYEDSIAQLEAEIASLRRKNELLCHTVEKSVLLSRIDEIINGMESAPDADYYGEWDDGMYLAAPSDVLMYLKKALETPAE